MAKRAALILAGGKARRFQAKQENWQDKALAQLSGKPLLIHVAENAIAAADEVVVCVNDEARATRYAEILENHGLGKVKMVVDEKISHMNGPNVAIMSGLKAAEADCCVTIPCDMPLLKPRIIKYLFEAAGNTQVTVPMWPNGRLETLVMVLARKEGLEITETLCRLRRPRSDEIIRGAHTVCFISPAGKIIALDPEMKSFVNINRREDLAKLQTRAAHGNITPDFEAILGPLLPPQLRQLREASALSQAHKFQEASKAYAACAEELEKQKSPFWGGIGREKEGETLLVHAQLQNDAQTAAELDAKGRDAFLAAAMNYRMEADMHLANHCRFLAERAWADRVWCESWVMGKPDHAERYPPKF